MNIDDRVRVSVFVLIERTTKVKYLFYNTGRLDLYKSQIKQFNSWRCFISFSSKKESTFLEGKPNYGASYVGIHQISINSFIFLLTHADIE